MSVFISSLLISITQYLVTDVNISVNHHHHHHHHHHFWLASLSVSNATRNHQPPELAILSHIDCFSQCEIMGLKVI